MWEGASLWLLQGAQKPADIQPHAHHAIQITFGLEGEFEIGIMKERLVGPVVAVASDAKHTLRATGAVALLFISPESTVGRALGSELFRFRPWAELSTEPIAQALQELRQCIQSGTGRDDLRLLGQRITGTFPSAEGKALVDARVVRMIDYARRNLEKPHLLSAAASIACLSMSRARHLFAAETGLPFKTYVLWLRLERAVEIYALGASLTRAAHAAGFSDSAHLSRTFRRTFGLPASALRLLSI